MLPMPVAPGGDPVRLPVNRKAGSAPSEHKTTRFDFSHVSEGGAFEGYASIFGEEDLGRDVVEPGAFRASLAARGPLGIKMLFQHDPAEPIGVWHALHEDEKGLYVAGRILADVARAREVLALMRAGALDGLSIGFHAIKARTDERTGARHLIEVDLWEISVVTFPMLPGARVHSVKRRALPTTREFERWLTQDAEFSRTDARTILQAGYKALLARRDAGSGADGTGDDRAALARTVRHAAAAFKRHVFS